MKRFLSLLLFVPFFLGMHAQRIVTQETLKVTDLGNQKLVVSAENYFSILLKTGNRYEPYITIELGKSEEALKLLGNLYEMKPKRNSSIIFDNPSDNTAVWSGASGYTVFSKGGVLSGHLRKPNIKGFIKAIKEYMGYEKTEE